MSSATIRRAKPEDGAAVHRIVTASLMEFDLALDEDRDAEVARFGDPDPRTDRFVAEVDGAVVGSIMLAPRAGGDGGWISKFFLDARYRRRGVGRALLARALDAARERGYRRLALHTHTPMTAAIRLYESSGWRHEPDAPGSGPCDRYYAIDL